MPEVGVRVADVICQESGVIGYESGVMSHPSSLSELRRTGIVSSHVSFEYGVGLQLVDDGGEFGLDVG